MVWYRQFYDYPPEPVMKIAMSDKGYRFFNYMEEEEEHFTVKESHTLVIQKVRINDSGMYYCAVPDRSVYVFLEGIEICVTGQLNVSSTRKIPPDVFSENFKPCPPLPWCPFICVIVVQRRLLHSRLSQQAPQEM
uniref:Ig-like domain-containing protein n=1 Tax=Erpetoichthys calabaricus TaxID=27687 RepID=A0A8C4TBY1_ERPCA